MNYPCTSCTYRDTPYVCEQKTCDKYIKYIQSKTVNPAYEKLAQIAYDTVLKTMVEGEKDHPDNRWKDKDIEYHLLHAMQHADSAYFNDTAKEDDTAHCLTRCAMIKLLEQEGL